MIVLALAIAKQKRCLQIRCYGWGCWTTQNLLVRVIPSSKTKSFPGKHNLLIAKSSYIETINHQSAIWKNGLSTGGWSQPNPNDLEQKGFTKGTDRESSSTRHRISPGENNAFRISRCLLRPVGVHTVDHCQLWLASSAGKPISNCIYHLVMTNSLPWYRWPIEIDGLLFLEMVIFHGELLNNQMVTIISIFIYIYIYIYIYSFSVVAINWNWLWVTYRCSQFMTSDRPQCRSPVGHPLPQERCGLPLAQLICKICHASEAENVGCAPEQWRSNCFVGCCHRWSWNMEEIHRRIRKAFGIAKWESYRWSRFWNHCESWLIKKSSYENCNFAKYGVYQVYHGNSLWNSWFWAQPGWPQLPVCSLHRKRAGSWKPGGWHHAQRHGLEPWNIQFSVDCYGYFMATSAMSLKTIWDIKKLASTPLSASLGKKKKTKVKIVQPWSRCALSVGLRFPRFKGDWFSPGPP